MNQSQFAQSAKFSDQLATMPDDLLPKLAQQYSQDAITLSLILNERNRRARVRSAVSAQQGAQPQPKVNEQVLASLQSQPAPEDVGIGALSAPNLQRMAGGGIVAFAAGGTPWEAELERLQDPYAGYENRPNFWTYSSDVAAAEERAKKGSPSKERGRKTMENDERLLGRPAAQESTGLEAERARNMALVNAADATENQAPGAARATSAVTGIGVPAQQGDALAQYQKDIEKFKPAAAKTPAEIMAERKALVPEEYRGKAYAGYEKFWQDEGAAAGKEKEQAMWMSIMQAGLATASGSSPYALKNIAEGMNAGLSSYKDSLKEFKKAEKERQKAMADIEHARRAEARGDADVAIAARDKADERLDKYNGYAMQGIAALRSQEISERGANARANAQIAATLNTPERQLWNDLLAKHKGDTSAAFKDMQTQKAEKFNVYASYSDYLKAFAGKENVMSPPKDFADYASQFGMPTTSVPKGAAVRKLPNTP